MKDKVEKRAKQALENSLAAGISPTTAAKASVVPGARLNSAGGLGGRGSGHRAAMVSQFGGTKHTERAVTGALVWLARHQSADGSWSIRQYANRCTDKTCTGISMGEADKGNSGATALGLLPFLAAGQTHKTRGAYRANIAAGVNWLVKNQKPDGDLQCGATMYSHGLATVALCESYGMTGDRNVGRAAQSAVDFIVRAQNPKTGGWRYAPGEEGDTSVLGWQLSALRSAQIAGLVIDQSAIVGAAKWLDSAQVVGGSRYVYMAGTGPSPAMSAVGLLGRQYLGAKRDTPMIVDGVKFLMANMPDPKQQNIYYWYYATQVLHNMADSQWDTWNRAMRKVLVDSQCNEPGTCANGSWNPKDDVWGGQGGRLMTTSLSALTLEIYYRYLPLFKPEGGCRSLDVPRLVPVLDGLPFSRRRANCKGSRPLGGVPGEGLV